MRGCKKIYWPPLCWTSGPLISPPFFQLKAFSLGLYSPSFSFRPLFSQLKAFKFQASLVLAFIPQIKQKAGPLTFKYSKSKYITIKFHFLHLKNPPTEESLIPFTTFFFFLDTLSLPTGIASQPPNLSISPPIRRKKKFLTNFFFLLTF